jgi:glycosyltransferase involved in cell wall biosynthesis
MESISVVIPTYNRARAVVEAVASVQAQTLAPSEIIVVDDGSTDGTAEALRQLKAPIRYVAKENGGVSSARNLGVRLAKGEWIAFLDSDDRWEPIKLERQMDFVRRSGCQVCFTGHVVSDGDRLLAGKDLAKGQPDLVIDSMEGEEIVYRSTQTDRRTPKSSAGPVDGRHPGSLGESGPV